MEKEALIGELKTRVGENDFGVLSAETVERLVTPFLPSFADDDKITDESWVIPVELFKNYAGQYRHDLAKGAAEMKTRLNKENENTVKSMVEKQMTTFKTEWEKTHKPDPAGNQGGNGEEGGDSVTKALEEYNKKLFGEDGKGGLIGGQLHATSEFIASSKKAAEAEKISSIRQQLAKYLADDLKASREPVINLSVAQLEITPTSNLDELKIQVEKIYEERYKEFYGDGGKPYGGDSAGGKEEGSPDDDVKKLIEERRKADAAKADKIKSLRQSFK